MADQGKYRKTLDELERGVHVPLEEQVEGQPTEQPRDELSPEEVDRLRLLGITGAGRLKH